MVLTQLLEQIHATQGSQRTSLENKLAEEIRRLLIDQLRREGLQPADCDDVAQQKCAKLVGKLIEGKAAPGSEVAYITKTAKRGACDAHRRRQRRSRETELPGDAPSSDENSNTVPEGLRVIPPQLDDRRERAKQFAEAVQRLLDEDSTMPARYRAVLSKAHGHPPMSIEELAREELRANPRTRDGRTRTAKQARDTIDQHLSRARAWLKEQLAAQNLDVGEVLGP